MVDDETIDRVSAIESGTATAEERRRVVRNLVRSAANPQASASVRDFEGTSRPAERDYDRALASLLAKVQTAATSIDRERQDAAPLVEELLALPEGQQTLVATNHRRYHTWSVSERLQELSLVAGPEDPARAVRLARLALQIAKRAEVAPASERLRHDLEIAAQAQLGNALRLGGQLVDAELAFRQASELLAAGTGDPLVEGKMLALYAALRNEQSRYRDAEVFARRAFSLFGKIGDHHQQGRSLFTLANALAFDGRVDEALEVLDRARNLIDETREPRAIWGAIHNAVNYLVEAGRFAEAEVRYVEDVQVARRLGLSPLNELRLRWVGSRIALGLGRHEEADPEMRAVVAGFVERGYTMEAATAALELAVSLAERRQWSEVRELAGMLVPVFSSQEVEPEALAALAVFRDAVLAETVEVAVVREVLAFLQRVDRDPTARFRPASTS